MATIHIKKKTITKRMSQWKSKPKALTTTKKALTTTKKALTTTKKALTSETAKKIGRVLMGLGDRLEKANGVKGKPFSKRKWIWEL